MTDDPCNETFVSLEHCAPDERYQFLIMVVNRWPEIIVEILQNRGWTVSKRKYEWETPI